MLKIDLILGVRPDFIQSAALNRAILESEDKLAVRIIHTGQHHDPELSQFHLEQLQLQPIHVFLPFAGGRDNQQLTSIMTAYADQQQMDTPDLVIVVGNSNSALACALVAAKNGIRVAHVDSGIRFNDREMIEELNDLLIDQLSSYLFTSNPESAINLIREGFEEHKIIEVGSLRSDAVFQNLGYAEDSNVMERYGLTAGAYILVSLHHSHIIGNIRFLISFFTMLEKLAEQVTVHLVLHPQSMQIIEDVPEIMLDANDNLQIVSSHHYHDMLKLVKNSALVLTDSQGLQEETSILGVQCLTLGNNTNRPITLRRGTNTLVGVDVSNIRSAINSILSGETKDGYPIDLWDGKSAQRIVKYIIGQIQA